MELRGHAGGEVEVERAVASVLEKLDARKRRAKKDMKRPPQPGLGKRIAQTACRVTQKTNLRHAREQAAFPKDEVGVQMADDGVFNLADARAQGVVAPQKGQRGRVVAKQNDTLRGFQGGKSAADFREMLFANFLPLGAFRRERVRFQRGQGEEGGRNAHDYVVAQFNLPETRHIEFLPRASPGGQPHATAPAKETHLAEFMVAKGGVKVGREPGAKFLEAFAGAIEGRIVGQADERRVAGIIAIGDDEGGGAGAFDELVQQMIVAHRMPEPEEVPVIFDEMAAEGIWEVAIFVIIAAGTLGGAGVMDVADDENLAVAGHAPSSAIAEGK
jgi:hypothetical protein